MSDSYLLARPGKSQESGNYNNFIAYTAYLSYAVGYKNGQDDTFSALSETNHVAPQRKITSGLPKYEGQVVGEQILKNFQIHNIDEVKKFLTNSPELIDIVDESHHKINEYFEVKPRMTLEVFTDPENNQKNLLARVFSELPLDEAMTRMEQFDRGWFIDKGLLIDNLFMVTLDFE
jgi:hypothetical protein